MHMSIVFLSEIESNNFKSNSEKIKYFLYFWAKIHLHFTKIF